MVKRLGEEGNNIYFKQCGIIYKGNSRSNKITEVSQTEFNRIIKNEMRKNDKKNSN